MKRNEVIDILKFLAVVLVAHSHMDVLYPKYGFVCTGGAIGDAIFFFISGYTLFLSRRGRFDNWYKRRVQRIYPTIIAWAVLSCAVFGNNRNAVDIMLSGGGYFVSCIMVFYVFIYWIDKYLKDYILWICVLCLLLIVALFSLSSSALTDNMYSSRSVAWPLWNFMCMLVGTKVALHEYKDGQLKPYAWYVEALLILTYLIAYYIILYGAKSLQMQWMQMVGVIPLIGIVYHLYMLFKLNEVLKVYHARGINGVIYGLGQLCLEVYVVQYSVFNSKWNDYFPYNVLLAWIAIFGLAYVLKVCGNFVAQTFKTEDYNWRKMFKL